MGEIVVRSPLSDEFEQSNCRACGREVATCFDISKATRRDDGDVDIEPGFALCDRCYAITGPFDDPPDLDAVDLTVVALREEQMAILTNARGRTAHLPDGTTFPLY